MDTLIKPANKHPTSKVDGITKIPVSLFFPVLVRVIAFSVTI